MKQTTMAITATLKGHIQATLTISHSSEQSSTRNDKQLDDDRVLRGQRTRDIHFESMRFINADFCLSAYLECDSDSNLMTSSTFKSSSTLVMAI